MSNNNLYTLGIDIGSTTVKLRFERAKRGALL